MLTRRKRAQDFSLFPTKHFTILWPQGTFIGVSKLLKMCRSTIFEFVKYSVGYLAVYSMLDLPIRQVLFYSRGRSTLY